MGKKADQIIEYLSCLKDLSPYTYNLYYDKFKGMSDDQIKKWFKKNKVRLYIKDKEVTQKKVDILLNKLKIVKEEKIFYPERNITSRNTSIIVPVQIRRLQQISATESYSNLDATVRDKVNQATRESRTSKLSDAEVIVMASCGMEKTLEEMLSPRSDNQMSKSAMNQLIREKGTFSLDELPKSPESRSSVVYLDALYKAMGLATDLVDNINDIS